MDPKLTGDFISSLRKEKNMTQKQLAEKLCVSDKAISRWETGRGYPDIDALMALSNEFSLSINELLCGKRIETPVMAQNMQKEIAVAYLHTSVKKRRFGVFALLLAVALVLLMACSAWGFNAVYKEVMGSPNCVIARDYSSLTLFGRQYVPIVLEDAQCSVSDVIIEEAQVEGAVFIGKLFFGESIYSVKQCPDYEIVYLQTDYDPIQSNYFCLESKVEAYRKLSHEAAYDQFTAEICTKTWDTYDLKLNDQLVQILMDEKTISDVDCSWSRGDGDEAILIYSVQSSGPFRREEGELIRKQGEYYWFDFDDIPKTQDNGDFSGIRAYEIDNHYDDALDELFSYMFQ